MTKAQKRLNELRERQSKQKQRMAELSLEAELTDETRSELDKIEQGTPDLERQLRAAQKAVEVEEDAQETHEGPEVDAEMRERLELRSRATLTNYLLSASRGQLCNGPEAELQQAAGVTQIPIELFDVERRAEHRVDATTPAPATGTGVNLQPVFPLIYARAILPRLGVAMPRTASGAYSTATITAGLSAVAKTKGDPQESTAATLTPKSTEPHRVSARLSIALEDVAKVGAANFEAQLRNALMLALSDRLDHLALTGDGTDPNPQGLLAQLTAPANAPTAVVDFNGFVQLASDGIDGGPWSETMDAVKLLVNADSMRLAERTFQTASSYQGEKSAGAYLREKTGGFMSSSRMPATASTVAQCLRVRMGTQGLAGVDAMYLATCPVWNEVAVDDIYSDSASGIRHFTMHNLIGDVLIIQSDAYERVDIKIAT